MFPFRFHRLSEDRVLAVSECGDFSFLSNIELQQLIYNPSQLPLSRLIELQSKFFAGNADNQGEMRLLASRIAEKKDTVLTGPSLHIVVPTLQCAHSCRYCQVSRSLDNEGFSMTKEQIRTVCTTIFESPSQFLTIEFQGGDPLLRFDLVREAIEQTIKTNRTAQKTVRLVVASTLHQLDEEMCAFFKDHSVHLSTSIDGPAALHNKNRPLSTRDSYERTVKGIELARARIGFDSVSALMTTSRDSLAIPEDIVDEYVKLEFEEIFLRPLSIYGFARRNRKSLAYDEEIFRRFYERALERVLWWNQRGKPVREVSAAIALNKMLSPIDAGYVDLQSPSGAGLSVLVYNYDGYVYPSDEARMIAESGDHSLRLGSIGTPLQGLLGGSVAQELVSTSLGNYVPTCRDCAFLAYCGPDPVGMQAEFGSMRVPIIWTPHCQRQFNLFDFLFRKLEHGDPWLLDLAYDWAQPGLAA